MVWMVVRMREGWIVLISMIPNWLGPSLPIWDSIQWLMLEIVIKKNGNRETKAHARDTTKIQITDSMEKSSPTRALKMWMSKRRESDFRDKRSNYVLKQHSFLRGVWRIVYKLVTVLFHTVYAPDGETRKNESESPLNERDIFNSITRKGKKETTNEIHTFKKKWKEWRRK